MTSQHKTLYYAERHLSGTFPPMRRNKSDSVAIGSHVAIPHSGGETRGFVKKTGLAVVTYPEGIDWNGETVCLVIGIAPMGEEHLDILNRIVEIASTEEETDALVDSTTVEELYNKLNCLA